LDLGGSKIKIKHRVARSEHSVSAFHLRWESTSVSSAPTRLWIDQRPNSSQSSNTFETDHARKNRPNSHHPNPFLVSHPRSQSQLPPWINNFPLGSTRTKFQRLPSPVTLYFQENPSAPSLDDRPPRCQASVLLNVVEYQRADLVPFIVWMRPTCMGFTQRSHFGQGLN
jgi:hypothetical protein